MGNFTHRKQHRGVPPAPPKNKKTKNKNNSQFVAADVRGLEGLSVCLGGGGVTVAAPHGAELRAELSVPAPVSHPKHY